VGAASRRVAIEALIRIERDGAFANLIVPRLLDRADLGDADRRLVTELVYGVTRLRRMLDHRLDAYLLRPVDTATRAALRVGAYQLIVLGTPPHAAVAATVAAVSGRSRTLVNAVLRRLAAQTADSQLHPAWPDEGTRLSYPDWVVEQLTADLGEPGGLEALEAMNHPAAVTERSDGYVQDLASQWVADLVEVQPGQRVADLCAAPGGKATAMAAAGAGIVAAVDLRPARVHLVEANRGNLGLSRVLPMVADGRHPPLRPGSFDRVLVDAPCSGLGALRRRPDARWRIQPEAVPRLAELQRELLTAAVELLAPGGMLVYSVCTVTRAETVEIDRWLADKRPDLVAAPDPGQPWTIQGRGALLAPQTAGTDGMYVLRLVAPGGDGSAVSVSER
jgi:16S rRNA (cytosine967-C5)-methyltransferase